MYLRITRKKSNQHSCFALDEVRLLHAWLVRSHADRLARVEFEPLMPLIMCCVLGQDTLLSQGFFPPIDAKISTGEFNAGGNPAMD